MTFNLSEEEQSAGEDIVDIFGGKSILEKEEPKSSFEKRQHKVTRFGCLLPFDLLKHDIMKHTSSCIRYIQLI